jgi:DeoR/GlpR family transcriptional regulator of sugar metabolism
MFPEERRRSILDLVDRRGRVSVKELSDRFDVSHVTIRADLKTLADEGMVVRTHGGAVPGDRGLRYLSLSKRLEKQVAEKRRIGERGASLVSNGEAIFLDSSSTALAVAHNLRRHRDLTIVTNALAVAQEMLDVQDVTVLMIGGRLHRDTASLVGGLEIGEQLGELNLQKGVFGAHGISVQRGLTDVSVEEAELKRALVGRCQEIIAVLDGTKWERVGLASFAHLEQVDRVITDSGAPSRAVERVRALVPDVMIVRTRRES